MIWYVLNILLILLAGTLPAPKTTGYGSGEENERKKAKLTCIVGAVNWILLSGLRAYTVGADTEGYCQSFQNAHFTSWQTLWNRFFEKYFGGVDIPYKDVGYSIIEKLFRSITDNYTIWLIFIAIVFTVPMAIYIYKYSKNACISWIVYSTLFYSFFALTGHRQTIATAIVVWGGFELIKRRKLIPFLLLVAVGYTIHASACCMIPFYWLSQIKVTQKKLWVYLVAIMGSFVLRNQLLAFLQSIVGYESYQQYEGAAAGTFMFLLMAMVIYVVVFWERISLSDNSVLNMSINALMIAAFFSPLLLINPSMMRLVQYYSIFMLFIIPDLSLVFDKKSQNLFLLIISSVMIILLLIQRPRYSFFFM